MTGFPSHVFAVAIDRDLIVFDSRADRYVALPGAVAVSEADGIEVGLAGVSLARQAAIALEEAHLLGGEIKGAGRTALVRPSRAHAIDDRDHHVRSIDLTHLALSIVVTRWQLARGIGCRTFSANRHALPAAPDLPDALSRLRDARLVLPSPRRCLPASIIAAYFLRHLGHPVEIVFGVRSHPFAAHCWIEVDRVVLDDDIDRVRAYQPIAVGRL